MRTKAGHRPAATAATTSAPSKGAIGLLRDMELVVYEFRVWSLHRYGVGIGREHDGGHGLHLLSLFDRGVCRTARPQDWPHSGQETPEPTCARRISTPGTSICSSPTARSVAACESRARASQRTRAPRRRCSRRGDHRDHLASVFPIDPKVAVERQHGTVAMELAHPNQANVRERRRQVAVFLEQPTQGQDLTALVEITDQIAV